MVPLSAISNRPLRAASAPVKAPFSWPNSSLSSSSLGIAPQLIGTNGRCRRGEASWIARDHFLAGAGLPENQHIAVESRDLTDDVIHLANGGRFPGRQHG
jgi:hypothetical protein